MLKLIHKMYRTDKVTVDIVNALQAKISEVEDKINDLYKQIFLDSATWYLELKEGEMSISKKLDDIDKRREYVKTRLLGTGTATKEMVESVANAVSGVNVEIIFDDMKVIINFLHCDNNKYLGIVKRAVENVIPYHLDAVLQYEHVNWGEVKNVTWGTLKGYTWGSVANSVKDTILEGLDDDFD